MAHLWVYKSRPRAHTSSRHDRRSRTRPSPNLVQPRYWDDLMKVYGSVKVLARDDVVHETHPHFANCTKCNMIATGRLFLEGRATCLLCLAWTESF